MSEFWGFDGAHLIAIGMILILAGGCFYMARTWGSRL